MKKQELIHLHDLIDKVRDYYEKREDELIVPSDYLEQGTQPTSIHKSKTDHKNALFQLAHDITTQMEKTTSSDFELDTLYNVVMDEAVNQYEESREDDYRISVALGNTPLSSIQADHLVENSSVEYQNPEYGSRLSIPSTEVEEWIEEAAREIES